jgi:hypothetical protein
MNELKGEYAVNNSVLLRGGISRSHRRAVYRHNDGGNAHDIKGVESVSTFQIGGSFKWKTVSIDGDYVQGDDPSEFAAADREPGHAQVSVEVRPAEQWLFKAHGVSLNRTGPNRALEGISYVFKDREGNREAGLSTSWIGGKRVSLEVDYLRRYITADIHAIDPDAAVSFQTLLFLKVRNDSISSRLDLNLYKDIGLKLGYAVDSSNGMLTLRIHRPYAHMSIPLKEGVSLNLGYQRHSYREPRRPLQAYGANLMTASLTVSF